MITNWTDVGKKIGSIQKGGDAGGDHFAQMALQEVLGQEWIESSVEHIVAFKRGGELAMNCLRLLRSEQAVVYAYNVYKSSTGDRASQAVWLIKQIAHPISFAWIEEFLNDENVMASGLGLLDQLLWEEQIQLDTRVQTLLSLAESKDTLREKVSFIREYLLERNTKNR